MLTKEKSIAKEKQSKSKLFKRFGMLHRSPHLVIPIILVNFIISLYFLNQQSMITFDGTYYIRYFNGDYPWMGPFPFGYPLFISFFKLFITDEVLAARLVTAMLGSALLYPLSQVFMRLFSEKIGLLLAIAAINPVVIRYSTLTFSDLPYLFFLMFSMWMFLEKKLLPAVMLASVSYLIRPEGLIFAAGYTIIFFIKERDWRVMLYACSIILSLMLVFAVENYSRKGVWSISSKASNIKLYDIKDWRKSEEWKFSGREPTKVEIAQNVLEQYPKRLMVLLNHIKTSSTWPIAIIGLIGLIWRPNVFWLFFVQLLMTPLSGANMSLRYGLPYFYPLLVGCGFFLKSFNKHIDMKLTTAFAAVVGVAFLFNLKYLRQPELTTPDNKFFELKEVGLHLKGKIPEDAVIMDRKPYFAFYSKGSKYVSIPTASINEVIKTSLSDNVDYLVLSERIVKIFRPKLIPLLNIREQNFGPYLTTFYDDTKQRKGYGIRIYKINKDKLPGSSL